MEYALELFSFALSGGSVVGGGFLQKHAAYFFLCFCFCLLLFTLLLFCLLCFCFVCFAFVLFALLLFNLLLFCFLLFVAFSRFKQSFLPRKPLFLQRKCHLTKDRAAEILFNRYFCRIQSYFCRIHLKKISEKHLH